MNQANALAPNWGQTIFQTANEIAANTSFRKQLDEVQAKSASEKEWWEKRRAAIASGFMKELDEEGAPKSPTKAANKSSSEDGVLVDVSIPEAPATPGGSKKKKGKK